MIKRVMIALMAGLMVLVNVTCIATNTKSAENEIKNIIYMIPDGGAMAPFYMADYVKQAGGFDKEKYPNATPVEQGEMYIKQYLVGSETTHSANNAVTDSAAAGTALSSGYKTNNQMIGITPEQKPGATILEASQAVGKNTGIVVTYEWTNATPGAFGSHAASRFDTLIIGEQMVNQGIDVVFGNTISAYNNQEWFSDIAFESRGYDVIKTREQLEAIRAGDRVWGKLPQAYFDIDRDEKTPSLAELTKAAIRALDDGNKNGFFLMVEGSCVDSGGHNSNAVQMVSEYLAFDKACEVAIEYAKKRTDTLVVILPDHDTGGLRYGSGYDKSSLKPLVADIQQGIDPSDIVWEGNGNHTARNGGIFMYVPDGVPYPDGIDESKAAQVAAEFEADTRESAVNRVDNIVIAQYLAELIGVDLDDLAKELFVDVTDRGTYDSGTETFTFINDAGKECAIERNTSYAMVEGKPVTLDGQVAVYLNNKFYAPAKLLTAVPKTDIGDIKISANFNTSTVRVAGETEDSKAYITLLVTKPMMGLEQSIANENFAYLEQTESAPWGEYSLKFRVRNAQIGDYRYYTRIENQDNVEEYPFSFKNMSVEKNGMAVEKMQELSTGDTVHLVLRGYDTTYDGYAIIGQYDENNTLIAAEFIPVQGEAEEGAFIDSAKETKIPASVLAETKQIKAYYLSNGFMPFTGIYVID